MKVWVVHHERDTGACGDPECCGWPSYAAEFIGVFMLEKEAEEAAHKYNKAHNFGWAEVAEVELT